MLEIVSCTGDSHEYVVLQDISFFILERKKITHVLCYTCQILELLKTKEQFFF